MKKILLADDSLTIQRVVELTFLDEDYSVESVGSGDAARSALSDDLDILITDIHVPGASGYDLCQEAKEARNSLPVLLLVGTFETLDEERFADCGANGYLQKPFDAQDLLRTVGELVAGAEEAGGEAGAEDDDETPDAVADSGHDAGDSASEQGDDVAEESAGDDDRAREVEAEVPQADGLVASDEPVLALDEETEAGGELSDELVERVARRVVELLGDDIVREVAWEVVPDLAEVVVRERLRELEAEVD